MIIQHRVMPMDFSGPNRWLPHARRKLVFHVLKIATDLVIFGVLNTTT